MPLSYTPPSSLVQGKENLNNDAFYRVVMQARFQGQAFVNVFYYRVGLGLLPGGINFGGAEALANTFKNQVWTGNLRDAMSNSYLLETITCYPYNGAFDPSYNMPFTLTVNEFGLGTGNNSGTLQCVIAKFNLEAQVLGLNGWFPPKRGYLAFGPMREGDIDEGGRLVTQAQTFYEDNLAVLKNDLYNPVSLVTFWPIRISVVKVGGVFTLQGFTDINGIVIRPVVSARRSRKQSA